MRGKRNSDGKAGDFRRFLRVPAYAGAMLAGVVLIAPSVSNALSPSAESPLVSLAARGGIGSFTPASVDPRLVSQFAVRALSHGRLFQFTPAGTETRPDRAVTVVVRVPDITVRGIAHRLNGASAGSAGLASVRVAPMAFNLGLARGYASFAAPQAVGHDSNGHDSMNRDFERLNAPDLRAIASSASSASASTSRLAPSIALDDKDRVGRAPRTLESEGTYQIDLGGSYRLVGNLNVTAGLRYSSDRDRLSPLTDRKLDSQAVYVGTQFRF